jgi:hypothetical protein
MFLLVFVLWNSKLDMIKVSKIRYAAGHSGT